MNKPFDLEAFKKGHKALTRDGRVATFIGVCEECSELHQLIIHIERKKYTSALQESGTLFESALSAVDLVSMVSRHQHLIDAYDPEDTWQINIGGVWCVISEPEWFEDFDYRLHPHNDLIKAHKNGAKIESYIVGEWIEEPTIDWHADTQYRIKPKTKTIYEWIWQNNQGSWVMADIISTEEEAAKYYSPYKYMKTGRSWEVEV